MKRIAIIVALLSTLLMLSTSCNDEWTKEQFTQYISFKAPLNNNGVTNLYVPYSRHNDDGTLTFGESGKSNYLLPVIVSGSVQNANDITVHVAHDADTLQTLNYARFQNRNDLFYTDMSTYATYPETLNLRSGEDIGLLDIRFNFKDIDLVNKWVLPIKVAPDPSGSYAVNPYKNYAKALLRVFPYNNYSGDYSATTLTIANAGDPANAIGMEYARAYVVDENTVFFYAGNVDETYTERAKYKIYARFNGGTQGTVTFWSDNPQLKFTTDNKASFRIDEMMDEVKPYLKHRYIIVNNVNYNYVDYTSVPNYEMEYTVKGTLTLERKINTQIKNPDYAIEWAE